MKLVTHCAAVTWREWPVLAVALLVPPLVLFIGGVGSGEECVQSGEMFVTVLTLTSAASGVIAAWEWQRASDTWLLVTFVGRTTFLVARQLLFVAFGAAAGIIAAGTLSACPNDLGSTLSLTVALCAACAAICFAAMGYVVGSMHKRNNGLLLTTILWCMLYVDPLGSSGWQWVSVLSDALPLVAHFWPRGMDLGFPLRTGFAPLLAVYTAAFGGLLFVAILRRVRIRDL